ncbi:class I SAM-dependent methyltransferase [Micromonospora tarensis]|uniref:Class I SAM-dependent methyltransferase n=1 Tax=Micromonospora tarensis TaxID=2806100 RepID=A0ABS1YNE9_9ACTN|nr:class I SAM-dependent methyltransferase [Micromonospora tarensis]MBM0278960.1 class I SAM-dependent methyltransferase [Micromonospora tarensis]
MRHGEFEDPVLVTVYDAECRWAADDDFFVEAVGTAPVRVLDLGCGTGRLTIALAGRGHRVTGVDPAAASLAAARAKPGAAAVTWIQGTAADAPPASFDVALMTSHVAQYLVGDDEWRTALSALRRAVVPGGRLVFDTRDPAFRSWTTWSPVESRHAVPLPDGGDVLVWSEATETEPGVVEVTRHYEFPDRARSSSATMRFRTEAELRASLAETGWAVDFVFGGWQRQPAGTGDGEFVVGAHAV